MAQPTPADDVHIGPSDHVPWLEDRQWAYIRIGGRNFGDLPLNIELKLEIWDSPNSAGMVIDAVRCAKIAMDRGIGGPLLAPSSYYMNSPPAQYPDDACRRWLRTSLPARPTVNEGRVGRSGGIHRSTVCAPLARSTGSASSW
jgi:myo-inositol-1-phosphate synthase